MSVNAETKIDLGALLKEDLSTGRKRSKKIMLVGLLLFLIVGTVALARSFSNGTAPPRYRTQEVQRGSLTVSVSATGNLEPTNEVEVGTEVSGTIAEVLVDNNDEVRVGQVLARLDTTRLNAQVLQSRAILESAEAKVLSAQATMTETRGQLARLQQVRELSGGRVPSQQELDEAIAAAERARTDEASARATVAEAKATLAVNQTDLAKAVIRSPVNGIVLDRGIEPGQTVAASLQAPVLFTLAEDLARMELHVDVDEADVGQVQAGQSASFTVDAHPDRTFPATISMVRYGAEEVDGVITYETILSVDNGDLLLRPGMTATAEITVMQVDDALLVPNAALRFTPTVKETETKASGGSLIGKLFPRPPRGGDKPKNVNASSGKEGQVWALRPGEEAPVLAAVTLGRSNGIVTEVVGGDLSSGMTVVTEQLVGEK